MGVTHEEEVEKGVGSSNPKPEGDLLSMMVQMMADLKHELKHVIGGKVEELSTQVKKSETRWQSNQNTLVGALKEVRASRSVTRKSDHLHRKASGIEHVVSRGNGGYREYVGNGYGMNDDGGYRDYKCYGGYSRWGYERGDFESRYHEDGLDRGSRGE